MKLLQTVSVVGCALLCGLSSSRAVEIPITSIAIDANPRGDQSSAIDNNFNTYSYLTAAVTSGVRTAYLGFSSAANVNQFRFWKGATDVDGVSVNDADFSELTFLYTTDNNPNLALRTYLPVTSLISPAGPEQVVGTVDSSTATVHAETGPGTLGSPYIAYTLQFDTVSGATGMAFRFTATNPQPDGVKAQAQFTHYPVIEFEAHLVPEPASFCVALLTFAGLVFAGLRRTSVSGFQAAERAFHRD